MRDFHSVDSSYAIEIPTTCVHEGAGEGKPVLLLCHGFADTGPSFLRRALPDLDPRFEILAPNGPFPMPKRVDDEWKETFAWYFADFDAGMVRVHPRVAAVAVAALVDRLGLSARPKILLGFSQGGYFLPHLANVLRNVRSFVVVGAGFQPRFFEEYGLLAPVHGIHGEGDEVIPFAIARDTFAQLDPELRGSFTPVPGMPHKINEHGRAALARVLAGLVSEAVTPSR